MVFGRIVKPYYCTIWILASALKKAVLDIWAKSDFHNIVRTDNFVFATPPRMRNHKYQHPLSQGFTKSNGSSPKSAAFTLFDATRLHSSNDCLLT